MDDVNFIALELQSIPVFKRDSKGSVVSDLNQLLPWNELLKAGQTILDPMKPGDEHDSRNFPDEASNVLIY